MTAARASSCGILGLTLVTGMMSCPATAQESSGPSDSLEEIVVSARKREESITKVPISISAFTASDIERNGIERPQDFVALTPGMTMTNQVTVSASDAQITIRGLLNTRFTEANFALVVDGVLQGDPYALTQELPDIQQIEVLKGPQGALYGRNAVAGAILIITKKPTEDWSGQLKVGYGNNDSKKAVGTISGALIPEKLLIRVTGSFRDTEGEFKNVFLGTHDVDNYKESTARAHLSWVGTDKLTLDLIANYSKIDSAAINFNAVVEQPGLAAEFGVPSFYEDINQHKYVYANNIPPRDLIVRKGVSLRTAYDLDWATPSLTLAWSEQDEQFLADGSSGGLGEYFGNPRVNCSPTLPTLNNTNLQPLPFSAVLGSGLIAPFTASACDGYQYQLHNHEYKSAEFRLTSPESQAWRWIGGAYFADINRQDAITYGADLSGTAGDPTNTFVWAPYVPANGPNPTDQAFWDQSKVRVYSTFGDLSRDIVPGLELSLAARYDDEERSIHNLTPDVAAGVVGGPINPAFATSDTIPDRKQNFTQFQPKVTLRWEVNDNSSLYGSYGIGFRSGGFNPSGTSALVKQYFNNTSGQFGTVDAGLTVSDNYAQEIVRAFELGYKSELFDRRLSLSAAVFRENVTDGQFFEALVSTFGLISVVTNIDRSHINGLELSAVGRATDWLTLNAAFSPLDTRIDANTNRPYTVGNKLPHIPTYTLNLGAQVQHAISANDQMFLRVDYQRLGSTWFHTVQNNVLPTIFGSNADFNKTERNPFGLTDLRWGMTGKNWEADLWSRNLFNTHYVAEMSVAPEFGGGFISPGHGRTFGVETSYSF